MTSAADIMESRVVTVSADMPLLNVYRLFVAEDISGAPVMNDTGDVVGVVSTRDLLRTANETHDEAAVDLHYYEGVFSFQEDEWKTDVQDFEDRLSQRSVSEVMTTGVISIRPDAPVSDVAALMHKHRIHRVLVLDEDNDEQALVGLVSVFDLVGLLI
jgi:CBS domain-containing protein